MARFIHANYPTEHAGLNRVVRGVQALGSFDATRLVLTGLAAIGAPFTRAAAAVQARLQARAQARRERRNDRKMWTVALSDARVMADLSRAMDKEATRARHLPYI